MNSDDVGLRWSEAMRAGDFEAAWRQTDRIELPRRAAQGRGDFERQPHQLWWDGTPFDGRSVLVRCEHGLGDTLQFLRFLPQLARRARELHLMAQPQLLPLLRGAPGLGAVHNGWAGPDWPPHEVEVEVMELAYALRCTPATLPPPYPHLAQAARGRFALPAAPAGALRVGLLWAASEWDTSRSLPLASLRAIAELPGVRCYSLQQGPAADDPLLASLPIEPLSDRTRSVADAASAMLQLDAIVCVDGMPAHLAGNLGRPSFLLLKHHADWRWMAGRSDTPWYPSMRLVRQPRPGDWDTPIAQVARELRRRTGDG